MAFCCCGDNFWYLSNSYPIYGYIERKFEPPCCFSRAGSGCYPPCNGDGTAGPDWVPKDSCGIRTQIKYYEIKRDHSGPLSKKVFVKFGFTYKDTCSGYHIGSKKYKLQAESIKCCDYLLTTVQEDTPLPSLEKNNTFL